MIYDGFTFFNEFAILETRLNEHWDYVDKFVLVEASQTFQGKPKPLHFQQNKDKFSRYLDKIIHVVVDFPEVIENRSSRRYNQTWAREQYQRDQIGRGFADAKPNDLVIVSDVDEIIRSESFAFALKHRPANSLTIFEMPIHAHFVNCKVRGAPWLMGPRMLEYRHFTEAHAVRSCRAFASKKLKGTPLQGIHTRFWNWSICGVNLPNYFVKEAGWHFTSIGDWAAYRAKVDAFSHAEYKETDIYKSEAAFNANIAATMDVVPVGTLPKYIQANPGIFNLFAN